MVSYFSGIYYFYSRLQFCPTLWTILKYLNSYWMGCRDIFSFIHGPQRMNPFKKKRGWSLYFSCSVIIRSVCPILCFVSKHAKTLKSISPVLCTQRAANLAVSLVRLQLHLSTWNILKDNLSNEHVLTLYEIVISLPNIWDSTRLFSLSVCCYYSSFQQMNHKSGCHSILQKIQNMEKSRHAPAFLYNN